MADRQQQQRRDFLKTSALMGAGLALAGGGSLFARPARGVAALYESGGLTAIAIADDCARLARKASATSEAFKTGLRRSVNETLPGNVALLGGMARMSSRQAAALLRRVRQDWPQRDAEDEEDFTEQKLALALGWMMHRAAREHLAPLYTGAQRAGRERDVSQLYPSERTLYQDAAVLRHRSARKEAAGSGEQVEAVARLFQEIGPRMLIRFHTFIPDFDDGAGWVNRLATWRDEKEVLLRRLAEAYQAPDPEKLRRYVTKPNFYDEGDAVIRVARALQAGGEEASAADVEEAVSGAAGNQSRYAQALRQGYGHLQAASRYFEGTLGEGELVNRLSS